MKLNTSIFAFLAVVVASTQLVARETVSSPSPFGTLTQTESAEPLPQKTTPAVAALRLPAYDNFFAGNGD